MTDTGHIRAASAHYAALQIEHAKSLFAMREHLRELLEALKAHKLSQQMIARRIGKTQPRISRWLQRAEDRAIYGGNCSEQDLARVVNKLCQMLDEIRTRPRR